MSRLLLLRHARAAWAEPGTRDFDRPLEAAGRTDAQAVGAAIRAAGYAPDLVICSTARRARETWEDVAREIGRPETSATFTDALYSTDSAGYLALIRESAKGDSVLVIGHNPMMEDMAFALAAGGKEDATTTLANGFPTAGLAVIAFRGPLADMAPGAGYLEAFFTPAEL